MKLGLFSLWFRTWIAALLLFSDSEIIINLWLLSRDHLLIYTYYKVEIFWKRNSNISIIIHLLSFQIYHFFFCFFPYIC